MITKELIERINYLSRKQRSEGLTPEEQKEQAKVRRQYLDGIKSQMRATLDNITIVDPEELSQVESKDFNKLIDGQSDTKKDSCSCGCGTHKGHSLEPNHIAICNCDHGDNKKLH